jgi:RNA 3'-terminal phosphate cyclase (ATP)
MGSISEEDLILIEGTRYEGGGGLIRDTLSYATLLNKPVRVESIRANRPGKGGLRLEHTDSINAMARLSASTVEGNTPCSREITFYPHAALEDSSSGRDPLHSLEIQVEGAAAIFMIAVLPYVFFSTLRPASSSFANERIGGGIDLNIRAGTLCVRAPSYAYVQQVLIPSFQSINIGEEHLKVYNDHEQGWHTEFGHTPGRMRVWAKPFNKPLLAFQLERRGTVVRIRATIHGPGETLDVFHEIVRREIKDALKPGWSSSVEVLSDAFASVAPGQYHLLLVAETEHPRAYLGYEQIYPQREGLSRGLQNSSEELFRYITLVCIRGLYDELAHGNAVDEHLEDILVPYQVLADGFSSSTAKRNAELVQENENLTIPFGTLKLIFGWLKRLIKIIY